ncbi:MAG: hypothetical protein Q8S44_00820 [Flavobacteriaceae bacterium]|nr:hypothetical protein [Flavobacteriaceae bacterium]
MNIYKISLILIVFSLSAFTTHKYYVSLTQIEHNEKEKSVEITLRVFTDDLELCLNNRFNKTFLIGSSQEFPQTNTYLLDYLNQKLIIKINGKSYEYTMIGKEIEDDLTYIYLEIKGIKTLKSVDITNNVFFEIFEDQQHIVKIKTKGILKNIILFKDKNHQIINL